MSRVHCIMMVRNEMGRYLSKALSCGKAIAEAGGGHLIVTDDASTDATVSVVRNYTTLVNEFPEPMFWKHEGQARQKHLNFASAFISPGDWVFSLDADETINKPELLLDLIEKVPNHHDAIGIPLYEFWEPTMYRVDGAWFGTMSSRFFKWRNPAVIADKPMACGSEPTYVAQSVQAGFWTPQTDVHLLHWGYLNPADRERKYLLYTGREGGNFHHSRHIQSIVDREPRLRPYVG